MAAVDVEVQEQPEAVHSRPESVASDWSDYGLRWLFNPYRFDHLPVEEQVLHYKQRNLLRGKVFKFGCRVFGDSRVSRRRIIVAPRMEACPKKTDVLKSSPSEPSAAHGETLHVTATEDPIADIREKIKEFTAKEDAYRVWIQERKKFRHDLDNMGLSESWLASKPDKTPMEHRMLRKMIEKKNPPPEEPEPVEEEPLEPIMPEEIPVICRPSPKALHIIEKHLMDQRLRLIDLFTSVDKNKDWIITRTEFKKAIKDAGIPLPDDLLEDLVITLDQDLDDRLDYRELNKGLELWHRERRESRKKLTGSASPSRSSGRSSSASQVSSRGKMSSPCLSRKSSAMSVTIMEETEQGTEVPPAVDRPTSGSSSPVQRPKSSLSTISSCSSTLLELPEPDLRPEQYILSSEAMVDLRKRNRAALKRILGKNKSKSPPRTETDVAMIKTGVPAIDNHVMPSTLGGETAEQVDRFRQLKLKEYHEIVKLCKEKNVPLNVHLLEKVLLFPPDKPHSYLKKHVSQPCSTLPQLEQTDKNKKMKNHTEKEKKPKETFKRPKPSRIVMSGSQSYPDKKSVMASPVKMHLSTGKAFISRQVDCWMSYEEYDQLSRHLAGKYTQLHGKSDDNAFWPGHLLDKVRLCMPEDVPRTSSIFSSVGRPSKPSNQGYNNNLRTWPISQEGFVQYGFVDPYKNKHLHN